MPPPPDQSLTPHLESARRDLLDLGLRNPLLNYRLLRARGIEVAPTIHPTAIFNRLVSEEKRLQFRPAAPPPPPLLANPPQPTTRIPDTDLPTAHDLPQLQKRLLATYTAARTSLEEQGVNTLYLALGMLCWTEDDTSTEIHRAPLLLIPVTLHRNDARDQFHLSFTGEEIGENIALAEKLLSEFGIRNFPELPAREDIDIPDYFARVETLIRSRKGWSVAHTACCLGFFSFAKFLMYRDLDAHTWPDPARLLNHPILQALLGAAQFTDPASPFTPETFLDDHLAQRPLPLVLDADSSQTIAMLDALDGRNMVIEGPPGTGKSQTIVNLIAGAIAAGKKVLFVSEKMAALEVVKRRLDTIGIGAACLELHSNRANKRTVIEELRTTVTSRAAAPQSQDALTLLAQAQQRLNAYTTAVNSPIGESGETPCTAYGHALQTEANLKTVDAVPTLPIDAASWTAAQTHVHRERVRQLQDRLQRCGFPCQHPFFGSRRAVLLPTDRDHIAATLRTAIQACDALTTAAAAVAGLATQAAPETLPAFQLLSRTALTLAQAPDLTAVRHQDPRWLSEKANLTRLLAAGRQCHDLRAAARDTLKPDAWGRNVSQLRHTVDTVGRRWWRFLSPAWRNARRELANLFQGPPPEDSHTLSGFLNTIAEEAAAHRELDTLAPSLSDLYGSHWQGLDSPWDLLHSQTSWLAAAHKGVQLGHLSPWCLDPALIAQNRQRFQQPAETLDKALQAMHSAIAAWKAALQLDDSVFPAPLTEGNLPALRTLFESQLANLAQLESLVAFNLIADACRTENLTGIVQLALNWPEAGQHLVSVFDRARLSSLLAHAFHQRPALATFDGADQSRVVDDFRRLDRLHIRQNRARVAHQHRLGLPASTGTGQVGLLWREFERKRGHMPLRKLMEKAGNAIQNIKPVFMMSPLSIANYLPPAALQFDLVIFDEASQVRPVDALGAIVRGKQSVVVGDSKQLPPSSFFDTMLAADSNAGEENGDDTGNQTADIESILGLVKSRGAQTRMLQWHYRSKHESLIAVSNQLCYNNQLIVFPSAARDRNGLGLIYNRVENAWYDRGKTRTNPREARVISQAVIAHARAQLRLPQHQRETLGVVAFSAAQMDAIQNEMELLRKENPDCEAFLADDSHEEFFIKNLENVQGDERDVIFISVGYARTAEGYLAMNFGPVSRDGGERRLNVLFTRARRRCEVFTSLSSADLDTSKSRAAGLAALKDFLHHAETGILTRNQQTGREADSVFETQVQSRLTELGYTVHNQIGCAGFFLDLAVVDPTSPGRYLLGIECDGAQYHSARSARDRDRLRQAVLESLGWRIYRVWSTDWFRNPEPELRKLVQAIETARTITPAQPPPPQPVAAEPPPAEQPFTLIPEPFTPPAYQLATVTVTLRGRELHELPFAEIAACLAQVVAAETPVHWREAARRVLDAAGLQRLGPRLEAAFEGAIRHATQRSLFHRKGDFLWSTQATTPTIRDRRNLPNPSRKLDLIAPEEIEHAILRAIEESCGMTRDEIPTAVCRVFGFSRVTDDMKAAIDAVTQNLLHQARLHPIANTLHLPQP